MIEDEAWRAALKDGRGIDAEKLEKTISDARDNRRIERESVDGAEDALFWSWRSFKLGDQHDMEMHGQIAFERCSRLHTLLVLDAPEREARGVQTRRANGARALVPVNEERKAKAITGGDALWKRYCVLTATGDRDKSEAITKMVDEKKWGARPTIYRVVKRKLEEKSKVDSVT